MPSAAAIHPEPPEAVRARVSSPAPEYAAPIAAPLPVDVQGRQPAESCDGSVSGTESRPSGGESGATGSNVASPTTKKRPRMLVKFKTLDSGTIDEETLRMSGSKKHLLKRAQSSSDGIRAHQQAPTMRDEVAMMSQAHVPWSETAELMAKYGSSRHSVEEEHALEDAAAKNSALQVMMQIRTQEDVAPEERQFYYRQLLVHPSEPWLRHWMSLIYIFLVINMVMIPFRGIFDPFGSVECTDPADRMSCRAVDDEPPPFFTMLDW